jgi:magnesium-transporting ATPase (P-type)
VIRSRISQHIAFNSSPESNYKIAEGGGLPIQEGNKASFVLITISAFKFAFSFSHLLTLHVQTECAIMLFADTISSHKCAVVRAEVPQSKLKVFPFDSGKKRMTAVLPLDSGGFRVFVKGAAEIILALCKFRENSDGSIITLSTADKVHRVPDCADVLLLLIEDLCAYDIRNR